MAGKFPWDSLPPLKHGFKRLYRGEARLTEEALATRMRVSLSDPDKADAFGRWYTHDPHIAQWYVNDTDPVRARMVYQDLPEDIVEKSRLLNHPQARGYSRDPDNEYFIPKEYAGKGVEIPGVRPDPEPVKTTTQSTRNKDLLKQLGDTRNKG